MLIAVDTELVQDPKQFVRAWNSDAECVGLAIASEAPGRRDLGALEAIVVVLDAVALHLVGSAVYDLLRRKFGRSGRNLEFEEIEMADGTKITRVRVTEA